MSKTRTTRTTIIILLTIRLITHIFNRITNTDNLWVRLNWHHIQIHLKQPYLHYQMVIHPYHVYTAKIQYILTLKPIILNNSTQPTVATNQNIQITPQQLVNIVGQLNSQSTQQTTNAPTPYYLQAALTQTPSPVVRRNAQIRYPWPYLHKRRYSNCYHSKYGNDSRTITDRFTVSWSVDPETNYHDTNGPSRTSTTMVFTSTTT